MPGDTCIVCENNRKKDPSVSLHRLPKEKSKRLHWLKALELSEDRVERHHQVCSRHFPEGDARKDPQLSLGKRFASPKKRWTDRAKRTKQRAAARCLLTDSPSTSGSTSAKEDSSVAVYSPSTSGSTSAKEDSSVAILDDAKVEENLPLVGSTTRRTAGNRISAP